MVSLLSILPQAPSTSTTLVASLLQFFVVLWVVRVRKYPHQLSKPSIWVAWLLCLLLYLFCMFPGDYFRYMDIVETVGFVNKTDNILKYHLEPPYFQIINFVHNDYLLFRLVVWGGALLLFYMTALRLKLDKSIFVFYLSIFIVHFSYTSRSALAVSMAFYGYALIVKPMEKMKVLSILLGIMIISFAIKFHRSAPFLLFVMPLSLLKVNRTGIIVLLASIPIIISVVGSGLFDYVLGMNTTIEDSMFDSYTAQMYLNSEKRTRGIGELIRLTLSYASYTSILVLIIKTITNKKYDTLPFGIQKLCNATILIILVALVVWLLPGANSYKTFERLIAFCVVPSAFVLSYFLKNNIEKKLTTLVTNLILSWVIYANTYALYLGED